MWHMNSPLPHLPTSSSDTSTLLSVAEAAKLLRVSRTTVWRWIESDKLPAFRVGPKNIRIQRQDLEKVVQPVRETPKKGGPAMERVRFEKPSPEEIARR